MTWRLLLCIFLCLCLLGTALADPVSLAAPLAGEVYWPEGSDAGSAQYIYRYSLPYAQGEDVTCEGINAFYSYYIEDALAFTVPINGECLEDPSLVSWTEVTGEVTCNNDDYFCVRLVSRSELDGISYEIFSGQVFAREGSKEGLVISLPYLLGILADNENDTWLQDRQTAKADTCVRDLIWEAIVRNEAGYDYLPDVTRAFFDDMFYPEEDFYLDATGNPVFFVQSGILTPESEGVLLFPLSLETILDEI